jgi:Protein of unknown function (DUF 659)
MKNCLLVTGNGAMLVSTFLQVKGVRYIANGLSQNTEAVVTGNVVEVITNNKGNCVAVKEIQKAKYPDFVLLPCLAEGLDSLFYDISNMPRAAKCNRHGKTVVKFLTRHQQSLALFCNHSSLDC